MPEERGRQSMFDILKQCFIFLLGIAGGGAVAGGVFAFITILGIVPRMAARTATAGNVYLYESCIILGGTLGNLQTIYQFSIPLGQPGLIIFGLFSGLFTGCLAMALTETLKVIPVFAQRAKLRNGLPFIILGLAFGKGIGAFIQFFLN